jgi:hypothetical protein
MNSILNSGHAGTTLSVAQADVAGVFARMLKAHRKVNANADPKEFKRYEMTLAECKKRGVRFLPVQAMRPAFQAAGL